MAATATKAVFMDVNSGANGQEQKVLAEDMTVSLRIIMRIVMGTLLAIQ